MLNCGSLLSSPNLPLSSLLSNSHNSSLFSPLSSSSSHFLYRKPTPTLPSLSISAHLPANSAQFLAQIADAITDDGPMELDLSVPSILATDDNPTNLQVATSVLLTGAITVFLFRSIRRRARRAKELKFRSTGATKRTLKEEALESLKAMAPSPSEGNKPPSPVQALLGGLSAGIIALILYKFTTTIEASLNRQTISDNFSVRQITITIRTIINGICYLATFVFGINSVGLILYATQLAFNSVMGDLTNETTQKNDERQPTSISPTARDSTESNTTDGDQSSDNMQ